MSSESLRGAHSSKNTLPMRWVKTESQSKEERRSCAPAQLPHSVLEGNRRGMDAELLVVSQNHHSSKTLDLDFKDYRTNKIN